MGTGSKKWPRSVNEKRLALRPQVEPPVEIARLRSELPDLIAICLRVYIVSYAVCLYHLRPRDNKM